MSLSSRALPPIPDETMFVIVASRSDQVAYQFAEQWADRNVGVLTSQDLSLQGWRYECDHPAHSVAVVGGKPIAAEHIQGVLMRLPAVLPSDLSQITPRDRPYVAAEMTAFLSGWLNRLSCPLLNRPTATALVGPNWSPQHWCWTAAQLGIPVQPVEQTLSLTNSTPSPPAPVHRATVTVVGDRTVGGVDPHLHTQAQRLAAAAGVHLLTVHFSDATETATFLKAELWADITDGAIATALWNYITGDA